MPKNHIQKNSYTKKNRTISIVHRAHKKRYDELANVFENYGSAISSLTTLCLWYIKNNQSIYQDRFQELLLDLPDTLDALNLPL